MSDSRGRRRTTKAVNYAKEQDFSDDDIFEDEAAEDNDKPEPTKQKRGRPRKSSTNGGVMEVEDDFGGPPKPIYTEKGYDPNALPLRERFAFMPEYEADGSPRIDLIVGRRPIVVKKNQVEDDDDEQNTSRRRNNKATSPLKDDKQKGQQQQHGDDVEYEYLIKYKGKSYLHLDWKTGADLESMNKSAKTLYRRFLKKIVAGTEEGIEDPEFDPSFAQPQKVVDEAEQEVIVELTDKELIAWEREREQEIDDEDDEEEDDPKVEGVDDDDEEAKADEIKKEEEEKGDEEKEVFAFDGEPDFANIDLDKLRTILNADGPYYPVVEGSTNPYRDGYITEPPKKPRASYLFFQCAMRPHFAKENPKASQAEIMTIMGNTWGTMNDDEKAPFQILANEEAKQHDKERAMMDKAQRPNEVWQPMRRCLMVLDRLVSDGFANIFLEPVDVVDFPDYEEIVDQPMDLGTIRTKLNTKKYQMPENFARDMRRIWNNCKVYNQHGSAIWFVADYMSKQFERLYGAWVQEYRDRYLRWAHPRARPWEPSCRKCDGKCGTPDDKMILCDHCDAHYGLACIKMKKLPKGVWHCPECRPKLKTNKSIRLQSAQAESAARRKAELGDIPKKKVMQKMYLVKWAGLGYEFCTWETKDDIGEDGLIAEYHKLNNTTPDEPDLPLEEVNKVLDSVEHVNFSNAGGMHCMPDLRVQLYAQSRAFQFSKFGNDIPDELSTMVGPKTKAVVSCTAIDIIAEDASTFNEGKESAKSEEDDSATSDDDDSAKSDEKDSATSDEEDSSGPVDKESAKSKENLAYGQKTNIKAEKESEKTVSMDIDKVRSSEADKNGENSLMLQDVVHCVHDIVHRVIRSDAQQLMKVNVNLPPLLTGEYDATIPITSKGLMMNVGEIHGSVAFLGYRTFPDGSKGPAELTGVIRNVGDKIIAVDGVSTIDKSFKQVIIMLRESGKHKYAFMRFLENRYAVCNSELTSVGSTGRYTVDELLKKFSLDRKRLLVQRKQHLLQQDVAKVPEEEEEEADPDDDGEASEEDGSEGEFEPDSDDEDLVKSRKAAEGSAAIKPVGAPVLNGDPVAVSSESGTGVEQSAKDVPTTDEEEEAQRKEEAKNTITIRQETTRSLARRLLEMDVGYSSDEGGDEDCIYYIDGVDETFTREEEAKKDSLSSSDEKAEKPKAKKSGNDEQEVVPVRRSEFTSLGDRGKIAAAIVVTDREPDPEDFINFPDPSPKMLEMKRKAAEELEQQGAEIEAEAQAVKGAESPSKTKRSTVKIEQVSESTGEVIRVWANAETAAATLQISLDKIRRILKGQYDEEFADENSAYTWRYALAGAEVTATGADNATTSRGSKKGKEAYLEFRDKLYDPADPHIYKNGNKLRDYQVDGVNWLASTWYKRHSCILADEMGLGKTVQIVTYIEHIYRVEKIHRPFLVVVPLSTVEHWRREFQAWTDMVCCVYHDRQRIWRDVMREYEWYFEDRPHTADYLKFDVLVTTYDTLIGDFDIIGQIPWRVAVVDEAHRLRNIKGKLLECMKEISAKGTLQYGFQSRVLMTGTPLQNNTQELWTLLNFIEPFQFPSMEEFQASFGNMANREQVEALQKKISPYMLRRVKEDVAKDIPAKEETVIDVELTSIQKQYYRAVFEHNHAFLSMGASRTNAPKLMNIQMELRKCCNHPFLLEGVEQREMERLHSEYVENGKLEGKSKEDQQVLLNVDGYVMTSGKMVLLDKLLPKLRAEGHKVLIFSQMVRMLDLISEYAELRGFRHERLDGRVRGSERQKSIDRFEREKDSFMFLLSTRAGGVGINLTAADTCIIFDSDWNPQNDVQAQARCHRIGQTKDVRIYRLVTSRTFEQEMFDRASKKLGLEQAVLGTFNNEADDDKPTSKEMEQLLKKGAYALLEDEDDAETKQFCADDIDSILAKRTRTRVVEGAKTSSWLNKQGMVVSKSKFSADGDTVNVDDPNFWQKVMPDFVTPQIMLDKLNELSELIEGATVKKGPGRGRGRWKKKLEDEKKEENIEESNGGSTTGTVEDKTVQPTVATIQNGDKKEEAEDDEDDGDNEDENDDGDDEKDKATLSRTNQRKVHKFMSDLKSMMDGILEEAEDDSLQSNDKQACQKLLLTISVKDGIFNEEERHLARSLLKRLEGDRRRRCRTSTDAPGSRLSNPRAGPDADKQYGIPDNLLILSKQQRRKRRKTAETDDRRRNTGDDDDELDEDGYLRHSDDEGDWSDVGEDLYDSKTKKRAGISLKEAKRRRAWAHDDDAATAAGRPWPAFPRHIVKDVLRSLLDEVMEYDKAKGGMFSEPVPRDEYPEYYEQIKKPMDYGTMKEKLERGEYRSAQAMQKDFVLIMQNCLKFNAPGSDVVMEARKQTLMRPTALRNASQKHNLFLAEDGSVLEIVEEKEKKSQDKAEMTSPDGQKKKRKRRTKDEMAAFRAQEAEAKKERQLKAKDPKEKKVIRTRRKKEETIEDEDTVSEDDGDVEDTPIIPLKKPRIKISINGGGGESSKKKKAGKKRKVEDDNDDGVEAEIENIPVPKKKRTRKSTGGKKSKKDAEVEDEETSTTTPAPTAEEDDVVENASLENEDDTGVDEGLALYMNLELWKKERKKLDGTFAAARKLFVKHGAWTLPPEVKDRFREIAKATLSKMTRHDTYQVFSEPVNEDEAPGYYDIVKKPMDFSKMMKKVEKGDYGERSPITGLYKDFLLVFDNCRLYNDEEGEVVEEAARMFGLLPETYVQACRSVVGKRKNIKDRLSRGS